MSPPRRREVDRVWESLVALVMDTRGDWRRNISDATGLPFSRVRALRRLGEAPMTLRQLAESMSTDAPAATATVNALESRGLVERKQHPDDRRVKTVSLTALGKRTLALARKVPDEVPEALASLSARDLAELTRIVALLR